MQDLKEEKMSVFFYPIEETDQYPPHGICNVCIHFPIDKLTLQ